MVKINLKSFKLINIPWLIFALLLIVPATWALFVPGFYGASDDIHIAWLHQMHKTLMMGQVPPRYVPDLSFGFGYPLFNFVFPLPFYVAELFHLLGFSLVDSIKALFFITIPLSGFFMYLLLRQFANQSISLMGAILYIYTPYRAVDLYVRGAIGEIASFVFLPVIILSSVKIDKSKNLGWIGIGAISLASLVLSHNITALMFFPFLLLLFFLQLFFSDNKKTFFVKTILVYILAFLISIYFWLPAIVESALMKYDTVFNFADHFPTIRQLFTSYWGYGASVPGPNDGISFFLGSVNIILLLMAVTAFAFFWSRYSRNQKIMVVWALICVFSAIFFMNYRSVFLWNNLPFLPYFQFPWRFLIITSFAIPILAIALEKLPSGKVILLAFIVLILVTSASFFRPQDFLGRTDEYFLNRYIPMPLASDEYKKTSEEYLRLPKNTERRPDKNYPRVQSTNGGLVSILEVNDLDAKMTVKSENGTTINYNKYFFPGWKVRVDGKEIVAFAGSPFGQISFFVPANSHMVEISFEETDFRKILNAISLASFLVSLWLAKLLWFRSKKAYPFF